MIKRGLSIVLSVCLLCAGLSACDKPEETGSSSQGIDPNAFGGEKMVYVIDSSTFNETEKVAVTALQGLANRMGPKLFLKPGKTSYASKFKSGDFEDAYPAEVREKYTQIEEVWIDYYTEEYGMTFQEVTLNEAFEIFSDIVQYTVDYDVLLETDAGLQPSPCTPGPVLTVAGLYDAIPYAGTMKKKYPALQDKPVIDLKGKFADSYEAYDWAVDTLLDKSSTEMAGSCFTETEAGTYSADLAVMKKAFVFKLNYVNAENKEHAGPDGDTYDARDDRLLTKILDHLDDYAYVWGWGLGGENALASRVAMSTATMINGCLPNGSFHAAVKPNKEISYKQEHADPSTITVENKVYIAPMMGAGDTYQAIGSLCDSGYWMMKDRGSVPFAWDIQPMLYKIMPALMNYFYETKSPNDYFSSSSIGYGYLHPAFIPKDKQDGYAQKINEYREFADLKYIDIWWFSLNDSAGNDIRWQWLEKTGYKGVTLWDSANYLDVEGSVPAIHGNLYFPNYLKYNLNETSGDQKSSAKDIADSLLEGTSTLSKDKPFCTVLYATSPWTVAELQKLLPAERFEFVTLDKLFAIAEKAQDELLTNPKIKFEFDV